MSFDAHTLNTVVYVPIHTQKKKSGGVYRPRVILCDAHTSIRYMWSRTQKKESFCAFSIHASSQRQPSRTDLHLSWTKMTAQTHTTLMTTQTHTTLALFLFRPHSHKRLKSPCFGLKICRALVWLLSMHGRLLLIALHRLAVIITASNEVREGRGGEGRRQRKEVQDVLKTLKFSSLDEMFKSS